jgi:hypothetical protein
LELERKREENLAQGQLRLAEKDFDDYAGMAAQLAIALASIAALTRRPEWFTISVVVGIAAAGLTAFALLAHLHVFHLRTDSPGKTPPPTSAVATIMR